MESTQSTKKHPVFLDKWYITEQIGQGNTSKVYLGHALNPSQDTPKIAIKILKQDFI